MLLDPATAPTAADGRIVASVLVHRHHRSGCSAYERLGDAVATRRTMACASFRTTPTSSSLRGRCRRRMASPLAEPVPVQPMNERRRGAEGPVVARRGGSAVPPRARRRRRAHVEARLHLGRVLDLLQRPDEAHGPSSRPCSRRSLRPDTLPGWRTCSSGRSRSRPAASMTPLTAYPGGARRSCPASRRRSRWRMRWSAADSATRRGRSCALLDAVAREPPPECADGCDPWQQYNLVDRRRVGDPDQGPAAAGVRGAMTGAPDRRVRPACGARGRVRAGADRHAGGPPCAAQTPVFRSGTDAVRVDVLVTDARGAPVTGLASA